MFSEIFGSNVFTTTGPLDMKVSWNLVSKGKWWLVSISCLFSNPSLIGLLLKGKLQIEGTIDDHHHHHHHDVYRTYALANQAVCHSENDERPPGRIMPGLVVNNHGDRKSSTIGGCGTPSKWPNFMAYKWGLDPITTYLRPGMILQERRICYRLLGLQQIYQST